MEVGLKASACIKPGQSTLDLVYAVGDGAELSTFHAARGAFSVSVK